MSVDEMAKLKALLSYWIGHNREHSQEFGEWVEKAKALGEEEVSRTMLKAIQDMDKSSRMLEQALAKLKDK